MTCENCGKPTAEVRRVTRSVGREGEARGEAVLVEGVPPVVCRSCGERFFSRLKRSANSNAFDYTVTSCQWRIGCRWHNSIPLRNTHSPRLAGVLPWVASLHHCDGVASNMSRLVPPTPRLKAAPDVGLEHPCLDHTTLPAQTRPVDAVEAWRHLVTACQFDQQPLEGHLRLVMSKVVVHFL